MAAGGVPANVDLGPGRVYYAPLGTAEPVNASTALPSAWKVIGYTEDGTEIATNMSSEAINVAEELDPVGYEQTGRTMSLTLQMAEATKRRLLLALGGGATWNDDAGAFEFPDASAVTGVMMIWDSEDDPTNGQNRRWLFRKCTPSGSASIARRKAPQKALIGVTFDCSKPDANTRSIKVFPNAAGQI